MDPLSCFSLPQCLKLCSLQDCSQVRPQEFLWKYLKLYAKFCGHIHFSKTTTNPTKQSIAFVGVSKGFKTWKRLSSPKGLKELSCVQNSTATPDGHCVKPSSPECEFQEGKGLYPFCSLMYCKCAEWCLAGPQCSCRRTMVSDNCNSSENCVCIGSLLLHPKLPPNVIA